MLTIILLLCILILICLTNLNSKEKLNNVFFYDYNNKINLFKNSLVEYIDADIYKFNLELYNKLLNPNSSILLIGNGPINFTLPDDEIKTIINSFDIVIRFNEWESSSNIDKLTKKCDICFFVKNSLKIKNYNKEILYVYCDCNQKIYNHNNFKINITKLKNKVYNEICNFDPSRGMLCILLLYNYYNNINIIGFGGKGHHTNIFNLMFHNQTMEHNFLKILKKINRISL